MECQNGARYSQWIHLTTAENQEGDIVVTVLMQQDCYILLNGIISVFDFTRLSPISHFRPPDEIMYTPH